MNIRQHTLGVVVLATAIIVGGPMTAAGQTPQSAPAPQPDAQPMFQSGEPDLRWIGTAMVGSLMGSDMDGTSAGLGAALTYLHRDWLGAEAAINFAPKVDLASPADRDASLGTYYVNALLLPRIEAEGFRPFASVGAGLIHKAGVLEFTGDREEFDNSQFGTNAGFGVMYFRGPWGVRSDIRYYLAAGEEDDDIEVLEPDDVLGDTNFWRWDIGVSYRWE